MDMVLSTPWHWGTWSVLPYADIAMVDSLELPNLSAVLPNAI